MASRRDRVIAVFAAVIVVALAASVVTAVLSAERNGRHALERLQLAQLEQFARVFDSAFAPALASTAGLTNPVTGATWHLTPSDTSDATGLEQLQAAQPTARTGMYLVDAHGVVTDGTLLADPGVVGTKVDRAGLDKVLAGTPLVLATSRASLTTPLPTIAIARPIRASATGPVVGALVQESDVAKDSAFNGFIAGFHRAKTDEYSFVDSTGTVISSTNVNIVGKRADASLLRTSSDFHRKGAWITASAPIPSVGWHATFRQTTKEFEGDLTAPLRSALLLLMGVALIGGIVTFFTLFSRLQAARREQARLAEISAAHEEFISIVSHELRTPATGQLGFLQTLIDHWEAMKDDDRRHALSQAYANARRLHALSRDVLNTASIEAGELAYAFETLDLAAAAQVAVDGVLNPERELVVTAEATDSEVRADPERIQQVLANMLDNAIKNSPVGSRIDVHVTTVGGEAVVEVSDRGLGLSDDEIERSFEKFSRGRHANVTGTGLGLYICRKIITSHGGRIWAQRRAGGGATVAFALPLAHAAESTVAKSA
ncbi:MAG TPA: ATP-binding protein [Acidimicrobiales bacterium]|nr:ATP-binding protein [Acidimicrobiales bacterium]